MKKYISAALLLLLCVCCLVSCTSIEHRIGRLISVTAVDLLEKELRKDLDENEYDLVERYNDEQIAELSAELAKEGVELEGEITCAVQLSVSNEETGYWGYQLSIGLCETDDVDVLIEYFETLLADDIEKGTAIVLDGGWFVSVTESNTPIPQD